MHNARWTISADNAVSIRSAEGTLLYTLHIDATGKSGSGTWKDGNTAKPEKLE